MVVLAALTACTDDTTSGSSEREETTTVHSPATADSTGGLSDADLAELLAVAVPAAIAADPDGSGEVRPSTTYVIADAFGRPSGVGGSVTFESGSVRLSAAARAAVEAALSPAHAEFVAADLTKWILLIAEPSVAHSTVVLTYEQRCGGQPDALCGSGGAFRLERAADGWRITEQLAGWIS